MGTGVGEAMLIGAAVGAGTGAAGSAIQGGDPLQGALLGAGTGAIGGGLAGAFNPAAATAFEATNPAVTGSVGTGSAAAAAAPTAAPLPPVSGLDLGGAGAVPGMTNVPQALPSQITSTMTTTPPAGYKPNIFGYTPGEQGYLTNAQLGLIGGGTALQGMMQAERDMYGIPALTPYQSTFNAANFRASEPRYAPGSVYQPSYRTYAEGGVTSLLSGGQPSGPVERMSMNDMKQGMYPQGMVTSAKYATPSQVPASMEMIKSDYDVGVNPMTGLQDMNMARGGIADLGGYSDGGRMLKGPGDGMSDSIPGVIGGRQPARLADGEFVVPADVVSHLGNGSTDAGAKQLYSMMDKVRKARTGKKAQGKEINPRKYMPA